MKKPILIGLICEATLAALALACLIVAAVFGKVALIVASAVVMLALLYIAGGFIMEHYKPGNGYFDWAIWFWNVFCVEWTWKIFLVEWTWKTFLVEWTWKIFLVEWTWKTFCKEWVWETFCKKFMWKTVHLDKFWHVFCVEWVWKVFCVAWVWEVFCKKFMWKTVHLDKFWHVFCVKWVWKTFCVKILYKNFDKWKAWLYLAPTLVLLLIFTVWPIINTVKMAFTVYWDATAPVYAYDENGDIKTDDITGKKEIIGYGEYKGYNIGLDIAGETDFEFGINNFTAVLNYKGFLQIMKNTVILCVATVPISTFLALLIAVCLNAIKPLRRFLQTIFFMPYVTNSIAIGMVFAAMFNIVGVNEHNLIESRSLGIINSMLGVLGFDPINWVNQGSTYWANIAVMVIYIVWNALPFKILILLGGLQSVNKQYYEAAKIDATPKWRVFTRITVPLLSPMITYVVITGFIGGFKEYTSIVGIFGEKMQPPGADVGTPRLQTMVGYIYEALETNSQGTASAAAILLFLLIFAVTLINLKVSKKKTHY